MPSRSIVSRLIWFLASALAGLWLVGSVTAAMLTRFEVNERLDNALQEVAQRLMPATDEALGEPGATRDLAKHILSAMDPKALAYQIVGQTGELVMRSPNAPEVPFGGTPSAGFRNLALYRVYTVPSTSGAYLLEVAEPQVHRREAVGRAIGLAVFPLLGFLPIAWLVIRWAVLRSFRSLMELQREIGMRDGTNLARIPELNLPAELRPIHGAVNRLLERLERALTNERQSAANTAHELRTPIAAALAQMQVLSAQLGETRHAERASLIVRQIKKLGELTEKLLQLSWAGAGVALNREPVDLMPVLRVMVDEFRRQDGVGERLRLDIGDATQFIVRSDIDALGIAVRNLLENAVRYGVPSEEINLVATAGRSIRVVSGGPVIKADLMAVLTAPFQRGTTVGQGRGLGLAIADSIMQQVGGSLRLASPSPGSAGGFEATLLFPTPETTADSMTETAARKRRWAPIGDLVTLGDSTSS